MSWTESVETRFQVIEQTLQAVRADLAALRAEAADLRAQVATCTEARSTAKTTGRAPAAKAETPTTR